MAPEVKSVTQFWEPLKVEADAGHIRERQRRDDRIATILDRIGFSWRVYLVAFLGFLASSWSLIAVTIITPALYYIYDRHGQLDASNAGLVLDMVTLTATVVGMVVFGHVADRVGRSAMYGFEVIIVMAAIGGAAFASAGYIIPLTSSLNIYASLSCFRFLLGLGIGAEASLYPMSAVIAAEFAPTKWRGIMLAAVFLAQAIGRLLAYGIGLGALRGLSSSLNFSSPVTTEQTNLAKIQMDIFWRLELALAGIPAIFAIGFRLFIPETPRFYSAVKRDIKKARESLTMLGSRSPEMIADIERVMVSRPSDTLSLSTDAHQGSWLKMAKEYYFGPAKGWKLLTAISIQWLLLDIVFYGVGLDNPGTLAALWLNSRPRAGDDWPDKPQWNDDRGNQNATVVETIENNLVRTLQLSSISALAGSILVIPLVQLISRKTHYLVTTSILSLLFACMAISVSQTYATPQNSVSMLFYALAQFMFNLGPNTLTFILAAEIFPTEVRGTSYGIAAAFGKIGAIIIRPVMKGKDKDGLVPLLAAFSGVLAIMALLVWIEPFGIGFPRVQVDRGMGKKEEEKETESGFLGRLKGMLLVNESLEDIAPWPLDGPGVHAVPTPGETPSGGGDSGTTAAVVGDGGDSESVSESESASRQSGDDGIERLDVHVGNGSRGDEGKNMAALFLPGPAI
ncbi:major facilitator superfamily domain containing protein [Rhypophila sp. PSN 637]